MSSLLNEAEKSCFRDLLNIASFRGREGSGVIMSGSATHKKPKPVVKTLKSKLISSWLAYSPDLDDMMRGDQSIAIGHARWPTKGGNDLKSIHPHRAKHIVGVHNGTMYDVAGKKVDDKQSDSALLFEAIADKGIEEAWKTSSGAAALVWIDENEQTLNFIRNSGRPLMFRNFGWQRNISTLYWASEAGMLSFVVPRHFQGTNHWDTYLPENTLYSYPMDVETVMRPDRTQKIEKPPVVLPAYQHSGYTAPHADKDWWDKAHGTSGLDDDIPFRGRFNGDAPRSTVLDRAEGARRRLAERVAEQKTLRAAKDKPEKQGEARIPAPPFHLNNRSPSARQDLVVRDSRAFPHLVEDELKKISTPGPIHAGKSCCWCGDLAHQGEKVVPIYGSDLGDKEFLCVDCTRNPDVIASGFLNGNPESIIVS